MDDMPNNILHNFFRKDGGTIKYFFYLRGFGGAPVTLGSVHSTIPKINQW